MPAVITHSDVITKICDEKKRVRTANRRGSIIHNTAQIDVAAGVGGMAIADIAVLDLVPITAAIKSIKIALSAADATLAGSIGIYAIEGNGTFTALGGTTGSAALLGAAVATEFLAATYTPGADHERMHPRNRGKTLYEILYADANTDALKAALKKYWKGEDRKDSKNFAIAFTCTAAPAGAVTMYSNIQYVEGNPSAMAINGISPDDTNTNITM